MTLLRPDVDRGDGLGRLRRDSLAFRWLRFSNDRLDLGGDGFRRRRVRCSGLGGILRHGGRDSLGLDDRRLLDGGGGVRSAAGGLNGCVGAAWSSGTVIAGPGRCAAT